MVIMRYFCINMLSKRNSVQRPTEDNLVGPIL